MPKDMREDIKPKLENIAVRMLKASLKPGEYKKESDAILQIKDQELALVSQS